MYRNSYRLDSARNVQTTNNTTLFCIKYDILHAHSFDHEMHFSISYLFFPVYLFPSYLFLSTNKNNRHNHNNID